MMSDLAAQLLADWSYYRTLTKHYHTLQGQGARFGAKKMTTELRTLMEELISWCREKHLEPRLWLFSLFKNRGWQGAPQLLRGHLLSDKQVPRYRRMSGIGFFGRRMRATAKDAAQEEFFDPNRDTAPAVEALKRSFVGKPQECLNQVLDRTLGFHPKSTVCLSCTVKTKCSIKIQGYVMFDIIALRKGELSSGDAAAISRRAHG